MDLRFEYFILLLYVYVKLENISFVCSKKVMMILPQNV